MCSCHFRNDKKANGPEIFDRNKEKLFAEQRGPPPKKKKNTESKGQSLSQIIETVRKNKQPSEGEADRRTTQEIILEAELDLANRELKELDQRDKYTVYIFSTFLTAIRKSYLLNKGDHRQRKKRILSQRDSLCHRL